MTINIEYETDKELKLDYENIINRVINEAVDYAKCPYEAEVNVTLTDNDEIKKINDTKNSIMICENLISTKGFKNSIVFVNGDSVSIIVGIESLKQEEVAQIQNIVSRELNVKIENIHISTK